MATDNYEHLIGFGTVISGYGPTNLGQNKLSLTRASVVVRHPDYCAWKYKHISPNDADFNEVQRVSMSYPNLNNYFRLYVCLSFRGCICPSICHTRVIHYIKSFLGLINAVIGNAELSYAYWVCPNH